MFAVAMLMTLLVPAGAAAAVTGIEARQPVCCATAALDGPPTVDQTQAQTQDAERDNYKTKDKNNHG